MLHLEKAKSRLKKEEEVGYYFAEAKAKSIVRRKRSTLCTMTSSASPARIRAASFRRLPKLVIGTKPKVSDSVSSIKRPVERTSVTIAAKRVRMGFASSRSKNSRVLIFTDSRSAAWALSSVFERCSPSAATVAAV